VAPRKETRARQALTPAQQAKRTEYLRREESHRRRRRAAWMSVIAIAVLAVLYMGAFPVRSYLSQQTATAQAESELSELNDEVAALNEEIDGLQTPEEIERRAREDYNLVYPGEEPFALLPEAPDPIPVPEGWPYDRLFSASG
jgi:cell division protein FtsB